MRTTSSVDVNEWKERNTDISYHVVHTPPISSAERRKNFRASARKSSPPSIFIVKERIKRREKQHIFLLDAAGYQKHNF